MNKFRKHAKVYQTDTIRGIISLIEHSPILEHACLNDNELRWGKSINAIYYKKAMRIIWKPLGTWNPEESLFQGFCSVQNKKYEDFTVGNFDDFISPFCFQDMQKAVQIIQKAIENKQRIMIFGDYDVDGISGAAQLYLTLKTIGAQVSYRLPSREDGYGLSQKFIDEAHQKKVSVFITTDCGVSNLKEITHAKALGMQVIVTDHHSVPETLPPADAIIHPLVPAEPFKDKHLTGSGVAWYMCRALLQAFLPHAEKPIASELLELAVLGTIADCGRLEGQNRLITQLGLKSMENTKNQGLKSLIEISGTKSEMLSPESIGFYLAPRINASGRIAHPTIALELLLGNAERAKQLNELNRERQEMLEILLAEAEEQAQQQKNQIAISVKASHWPSGIIGLISGRLAEKYARPVIAWEIGEKKITGSCRGPVGFHIANALKSIKEQYPHFFLGCGGHAQAAGLSIFPEYFDEFWNEYSKIVKQIRGNEILPPEKEFCFVISRSLSLAEIDELWKIAPPFGIGNPMPVFCWESMKVLSIKTVGADQSHVSCFLQPNFVSEPISGIFFRGAESVKNIKAGDSVTIFATPEKKEWNGKVAIGVKIVDMQKV